jgi:4-hydroxybenzoate polyprenyltransferase
MKKKLLGIIALARWTDTIQYSIVVTLIAVVCAGGYLGWRALILFFVNWLSIIFAYVINDVEDAEDDARDVKKAKRNPVSNGSLTKKEGYLVTLAVFLVTFALYIIIAINVNNYNLIWFGLSELIVGFFYSWKPFRFKSMPIIDFLSHGFMLGFASYVTVFYAFNTPFTMNTMLLGIMIFMLSVHGDFENENRDYIVDKEAKLNNTVQLLGNPLIGRIVQYSIAAVGVLIGLYIFFNIEVNRIYAFVFIGFSTLLSLVFHFYRNFIKKPAAWIEVVNTGVLFASVVVLIIYLLFN